MILFCNNNYWLEADTLKQIQNPCPVIRFSRGFDNKKNVVRFLDPLVKSFFIIKLSDKCKRWRPNDLRSGWKWKRGAKIIASPFPCWHETQTEKINLMSRKKIYMITNAWSMINPWRSVFTMILHEAMLKWLQPNVEWKRFREENHLPHIVK